MPQCQYCGKNCGNEGAKSSHEAHCDEKPTGQPQATDAEVAQAQPAQQSQPQQQAQQAAEPPAPQQKAQQGQEQAIQTQQEGALGAGMEIGKALTSIATGSPEEQAAGKGELMKAMGATIASTGEQIAQEKIQGAQRSKEIEDGDLRVAENYANCPSCSGQITNVPPSGEEFQCPHCGTILISP